MSSATMPAVALENDSHRYPATQAGVADTTLRVNAATP
jgi:hypothetical protein